jgi:branched-subunit amino acid transport protein
MSDWWRVIAMALGVCSLRLAGFIAPVERLPSGMRSALGVLPVALLAALIATSRAGLASGEAARIGALLVAGVVSWHYRRVWLVIVSGLATFWLLTSLEQVAR